MKNPFRRYLTKEHILHEACVLFCKLQYPKIFITHHPNESKKTPFERYLYKILGVKTGVPDLLIFTPSKGFNGLAIELKIAPNKPTAIQNETLADLEKCNWKCVVIYDLDAFRAEVNAYFRY